MEKNERTNMRRFCFSESEIRTAARKVKNGRKYKGKPKKDLRTFDMDVALRKENALGKFFANEAENIEAIISEVRGHNFKIKPYQAIIIPRPGKKPRGILVPTPRDRIIFTAALNRLKDPLYFLQQKFNIFGSARHNDLPTIKDILSEITIQRKKYAYLLKVDIIDFFPSISKSKLLADLAGTVKDECVLGVVKASLYNKLSYIKDANNYKDRFVNPDTDIGIPQGCAYSPLLANFYGRKIDEWLQGQGLVSFRYLDDLLIFTNDRQGAERVFRNTARIANDLGLKFHELNKDKTKSYSAPTTAPFEYLGITITKDGKLIPDEKVAKFLETFKSNFFNLGTIKKHGIRSIFDETEQYVRGWGRYYEEVCPEHFAVVRDSVNKTLKTYISKKEYRPEIEKYAMDTRRILL